MTVWYDFTTTVRNRGRSGIANVEWNIGQALRQADPGVRCFELSGRHGLIELDSDIRLADAVYASPTNPGARAINSIPNWRDDVRSVLLTRMGHRAEPVIRAMSTAYQLPAAARRLGTRDWSATTASHTVELLDVVRSGDLVVSMGADWGGGVTRSLSELKRRTGCRVATMVYDLVPLTHTHLAFHNDPKLFDRYYRGLIDASDVITCISAQSKRDLVDFAAERNLTLPTTAVLVLGETPPMTGEEAGSRQDFYLCVGTIERRKNLELIYDALRILDSEGRDLPRVVVAGSQGWGTDDLIVELQHQSTPASRAIVLLGSVDDQTLDGLYRRAKALLFPSHFEGWGLPIREAAIRGCPVAAGDSQAAREAAAGFAGATLLPTDDPGPWADFLRSDLNFVEPASLRSWSEVAGDLRSLLTTAD